MDENELMQKGFSVQWQSRQLVEAVHENDYYSVRGWQKEAFEQLKNASQIILNAPMGSGKSWMMCLLSAWKMKQNPHLKSIISVPQTIIASGFIHAKILMPNGEKLDWQINHNLCDDTDGKPVQDFIVWLENPSENFNDRSIICTHATLVRVYKKLKSMHRLDLLQNILLFIDEAHHVKNIETEEVGIIHNALGEIVAYFLNHFDKNLQIGLTTASFFRGDRATLLTDTMIERFKRYDLPYDTYLQSMKYLRSFNFDFLLCGHDYTKAIGKIIESRQGKDIIYIPYRNSAASTNNKHQEAQNIINLYGSNCQSTKEGLTIVENDSNNYKILNLVDEYQRQEKKNYLNNRHLKKDSTALDVIIALGMFKEGSNWIFADRAIIVGARSSLVDVVQMVGRLFRDVENKHHVEVIQLLPFSLDQQDKEKFRENLNNYLKAIFASLILENILNPIKIKALNKTEKNKQSEDYDKEESINWLSKVLPDDVEQQKLKEDITNCLINIMQQKPETETNSMLLRDELDKAIPDIFKDYGISEYQEEVVQQIWATFTRKSMQMDGISIENIDFNIVHEINPLGFLLKYTSGVCNIDTFNKLREAIYKNRIILPFEPARDIARSLNLKTKDKWIEHAKQELLPAGVPKAPHRVYDEFKGWPDWLGTTKIANQYREFLSYEQAKEFVQQFSFKTQKEYTIWAKSDKRPINIPAYPNEVYKNSGWISWGVFLHTGNIANKYIKMKNFEEAKKYIQLLKFSSVAEYRAWAKTNNRPIDIPSAPSRIYANDGWINWQDFLGY